MTEKLRVRVHPGARRNAIRAWLEDGTLQLDVTAPPEDGRANRAVCDLIAVALKVPRRQVSVTRGAGSRLKELTIEGVEAGTAKPALDALLKEQERSGQ